MVFGVVCFCAIRKKAKSRPSKNDAVLSPSLLPTPNSIYRFCRHSYTSVHLLQSNSHIFVEFLYLKVGFAS